MSESGEYPESVLNAVAEINAYPNSERIDALIDDYRTDRQTLWTSDDVIEIDEVAIPSVLADGLYFGARSDIRDMSAKIDEFFPSDSAPTWELEMSFVVKSYFKYFISANNEQSFATVHTEDDHGNSSSINMKKADLVHFLAALLVAFQERSEGQSFPLNDDFIAKAHQKDEASLSKAILLILNEFSEISGIRQSITNTTLPRDDEGNLVRIKKTEKVAPNTQSCDIEVEIVADDPEKDTSNRSVVLIGATNGVGLDEGSQYAERSVLGITSDNYYDALDQSRLLDTPIIPIVSLERILPHNDNYGVVALYCARVIGRHIKRYHKPHEIIPLDDLAEEDTPAVFDDIEGLN